MSLCSKPAPCQPKPTTTGLCTRPGNHGNVRASSMLPFQEAGTAPDTLPGELDRDCSRADGYAQTDSSCTGTGAAALCSPACSSWPSAALAAVQSLPALARCCGMAVTKLLAVPWLWSGTELTSWLLPAPGCSQP